MNGAVYISFFQGQLESVLEQVVQLAVQEISKTVGSSLNSMLLETAAKEQENQRLQLKLQSRESGGRHADNGSPVSGKAGGKTADSAGSGRTKPEQQRQQQQHTHAPGHGAQRGVPADTRRLEQKGRVVGQLKAVMEQVLDFAVCELTKIVEASFDDLLLEITKKEREQLALEERLGRSSERGAGGAGENGRGSARRRGSENDSVSPSGSEDAREEPADIKVSKEMVENDDPDRPAVLSVSQDWVPILGKVFGQKWCSDVWHVKECGGGDNGGGRGLAGGRGGRLDSVSDPDGLQGVDLEPSPTSPQQDPRWTPLEDMEVLSPEEDTIVEGQRQEGGRAGATGAGPTPGPTLSPTEISGRRSSASMLQRLLTLPAQLVEEDEEGGASAVETLAALATEGTNGRRGDIESEDQNCTTLLTTREAEQGEEAEEEVVEEDEEEFEDKGRKKKRRRVWLECQECGRRFSRASLLKAHRQTHAADSVIMETSSSYPTAITSTMTQCSECGKQFSSVARLQGHLRTQHPVKRS